MTEQVFVPETQTVQTTHAQTGQGAVVLVAVLTGHQPLSRVTCDLWGHHGEF